MNPKSLKTEEVELLQKGFAEMQSLAELVSLLNQVRFYQFGEKASAIRLKSVALFSNPARREAVFRSKNQKVYSCFTIPKRSGKSRTIHAPNNSLKIIQRSLSTLLQCVYRPNNNAQGFLPGRSIVTNASHHVSRPFVYNIDIKDFFPSVSQARVCICLMLSPFNLGNSEGKIKLARAIAALCCELFISEDVVNPKYSLPQGAPTSPILTNIVCKSLDKKLNRLAKRYKSRYTRYADDITFSSFENHFSKKRFQRELIEIIESERFTLNQKKSRLQKSGYSQEVTGLIVNEKVNVTRKYRKGLRLLKFIGERKGTQAGQAFLMKRGIDTPFERYLLGKSQFVRMIKNHPSVSIDSSRLNKVNKIDYHAAIATLFSSGEELNIEAVKEILGKEK